jgi:hypothetical protein
MAGNLATGNHSAIDKHIDVLYANKPKASTSLIQIMIGLNSYLHKIKQAEPVASDCNTPFTRLPPYIL